MEEKDEGSMHYVEPKKDCPHIGEVKIVEIKNGVTKSKCKDCEEKSENWMCLSCGVIGCSRYKNSHMVDHIEKNFDHPVAVSFYDLSFWCYKCESYIVSENLREIYRKLSFDKHGEEEKKRKEEELKEHFDTEDETSEKVKKVAKMVKESKYTVIYTGAGISTSASIPDYRGPRGVWTLKEKGEKVEMKIKVSEASPTFTHMAMSEMIKNNYAHFIISTNVDGLHMKSGVDMSKLSELHGNIFKEFCDCGKVYYRDFDTTEGGRKTRIESGGTISGNLFDHETSRKCECGKILKDSIVCFGEPLPTDEISKAWNESEKSELSIILGTSLKVQPACSLPFLTKKKDGKVVLVNLQKTKYDEKCDIKVHAKCDEFMKLLIKELKLEIE